MGFPKVKSSTELRETLSETLSEVNKGSTHIISHKSGNVVLISEAEFSHLMSDLENLKEIALGISELDAGEGIEHSKALTKISQMKKKWK